MLNRFGVGGGGGAASASMGVSRVREPPSWSIREIWALSESTPDLQKMVIQLLEKFGSPGAKHLDMTQMQACYDFFCLKALLDDDWSRHRTKLLKNIVEPSDMFTFFRDLLVENLHTNLKPERLEVKRQLLVRQNKTGTLEEFYTVGKKLGEGTFGSVHIVETKITKEVR